MQRIGVGWRWVATIGAQFSRRCLRGGRQRSVQGRTVGGRCRARGPLLQDDAMMRRILRRLAHGVQNVTSRVTDAMCLGRAPSSPRRARAPASPRGVWRQHRALGGRLRRGALLRLPGRRGRRQPAIGAPGARLVLRGSGPALAPQVPARRRGIRRVQRYRGRRSGDRSRGRAAGRAGGRSARRNSLCCGRWGVRSDGRAAGRSFGHAAGLSDGQGAGRAIGRAARTPCSRSRSLGWPGGGRAVGQ